jgi:hypothetical protein
MVVGRGVVGVGGVADTVGMVQLSERDSYHYHMDLQMTRDIKMSEKTNKKSIK